MSVTAIGNKDAIGVINAKENNNYDGEMSAVYVVCVTLKAEFYRMSTFYNQISIER